MAPHRPQPKRKGPLPGLAPTSEAALMRQLQRYLRRSPALGRGVYLARGAVVVGDVRIGDFSSVWYNAVLRGDIDRIVVGHHTNIQDNAVLHLAVGVPCILGNYVTVGHGAVVHACTVRDEVLVGMGSTVLDGAVIGKQSIIGAGALVPPGTRVPSGSLVVGVPGRVVRKLGPAERLSLRGLADRYAANAAFCLARGIGCSPPSR